MHTAINGRVVARSRSQRLATAGQWEWRFWFA